MAPLAYDGLFGINDGPFLILLKGIPFSPR